MSDATIHQNGKVYKYKNTYTKPLTEMKKTTRKKRTCLKCEKSFQSVNIANRICSACRTANNQKIDGAIFGALV